MAKHHVLGVFLAVAALGVGIYAATTPQSGRKIAPRAPAQQQPQQAAQPAASDDTATMTSDDVAPVGHAPSAKAVAGAAGPIAWKTSFNAAKKTAKADQVIFVDVYTDWCGWCKYMDQRVYTDNRVQSFAADQVFVRLNAEDGAEGTAFARSVGVQGFPTLLVYSHDGKLLGSQPGAFRRADDFLNWLNQTSTHN